MNGTQCSRFFSRTQNMNQSFVDRPKVKTGLAFTLVVSVALIAVVVTLAAIFKKECFDMIAQAKNMIMYVIIGLAVIWAAPLIVKLVMGS